MLPEDYSTRLIGLEISINIFKPEEFFFEQGI
jgi:hypothetical protein